MVKGYSYGVSIFWFMADHSSGLGGKVSIATLTFATFIGSFLHSLSFEHVYFSILLLESEVDRKNIFRRNTPSTVSRISNQQLIEQQLDLTLELKKAVPYSCPNKHNIEINYDATHHFDVLSFGPGRPSNGSHEGTRGKNLQPIWHFWVFGAHEDMRG